MLRMAPVAVALVLLTTMLLPAAVRADEYAQGQKLFKQKKFAPALLKYRQALEANPHHAWAHYQVARTLSVLRDAGKTCDHKALKRIIEQHLFKACQLNAKIKRRVRKDKTLKTIHDTIGWQRLMGRTINEPKHIDRILRAVSWYGPAQEGTTPTSGISFKAKGKMVLWTQAKDGQAKTQLAGHYRVQRTRVIVTLNKAIDGTKEFEGQLKLTGELWLPGLPGPFDDDPKECR
jgi:hypothetical protein